MYCNIIVITGGDFLGAMWYYSLVWWVYLLLNDEHATGEAPPVNEDGGILMAWNWQYVIYSCHQSGNLGSCVNMWRTSPGMECSTSWIIHNVFLIPRNVMRFKPRLNDRERDRGAQMLITGGLSMTSSELMKIFNNKSSKKANVDKSGDKFWLRRQQFSK